MFNFALFRFFSSKNLTKEEHHKFIIYEMLRREYLNQTFNFIPDIFETYNNITLNKKYEIYQEQVLKKDTYMKDGKISLLI